MFFKGSPFGRVREVMQSDKQVTLIPKHALHMIRASVGSCEGFASVLQSAIMNGETLSDSQNISREFAHDLDR